MLDNMATSLQHALCCWSSSQQSPVDDHPSSPSSPESPCSAHSVNTCTCDRPLASTTTSKEKTTQRSHCCYHERLARTQMYASQRQQHQQQQQQQAKRPSSSSSSAGLPSGSLSPPRRTWPRSSHIKGVLAKKNGGNGAPSAHDVVSPYHSTTFMLTPPSAYHYDAYASVHHSTSPGKSPSKRVSLQKYYYGRNSMNAARAAAAMASSRTPSPPPSSSPSSPTTTKSVSVPVPALGSGSGSILGLASLSPQPLSSSAMDADVEMISAPGQPGTSSSSPSLSPPTPSSLSFPTKSQLAQGSTAGSSTFEHTSHQPLFLTIAPPTTVADTNADADQDMPSQRRLSPPTLTTILATPVSPSRPSLPLSCSPPSVSTLSPPSMSFVPTSPVTSSSPSSPFSCSPTSSSSSLSSSPSSMSYLSSGVQGKISSPEESETTPFPASAMSAAKLANMLQQANQGAGVSAGSRHRPLILDLRPHPEFYPVSIMQSININLPTLLMRRYRRGGPISSFALESFITMPSDKDLYHQILDSWRGAPTEERHDVIVLDQDMRAGSEEYGRSATAAWTLLNVLERGCGQGCFGGAAIRVWYIEGGFDAFHAWDAGEKFLVRPGMLSSTLTASPSSSPSLGPISTQNSDQDVEMTTAKDQQQQPSGIGRKPSLLAINTSVAFVPKQRTPARRESLFSLNTKSLQRPAGLNRSQTVNLKPLTIPAVNTQLNLQRQQQQHHSQQKGGSWLTVPSTSASSSISVATPALSPAMSTVSNHSMEIAHSASTEHTASSCWSADSNSINGSAQFPLSTVTPAGGMVSMLPLNTKPSISSLRTLNSVHGINSSTVSVREEDEDEFHHPSLNSFNSSQISQDFYQEYNNRMFKHSTSISQHYPSSEYTAQELQQGRVQRDRSMSTYSSSDSLHGHKQQDAPLDEENFDDGEQEISCILPGFLYLGPEIVNADQVQTLERLGVKRILNMATECEDLLVSSHQQSKFQYHKVGVYDHIEADVSAGLSQAVDIIAASKDSPIYVHCKAGKSRSVTATIAYLITQLHWPLNKAYKHVLTQRPCMCPNIGFVAELMRMEEKTLGAEKAGGLNIQS
ncbi:hypothetical protein EMPS_07387 [Entomortierella parvispora]|uniref:protein-tyrosine-phosphatase n=1 Tax=Entomortierella parvispora TaxID=205924 RepID=A0A9P3HE74_9FUNG|nr:hypothetical protein EMPS_07387 [Entomortierella parvispora]